MSAVASSQGFVERVLVVEDDEVNRLMMVRMLQAEGYTVDSVDRAEKAVLLNLEGYDIVLCDFRLPGADGKSLVRVITKELGENAPAIVFVTACASVEELAPNTVVPKPFSRSSR